MLTNGANNSEETEMAECDGEIVVTMMDVLQEQQEFEEDANAVLGGSDDKNCTYAKGYIKRQAVYACMTCCAEAKTDPTKRAGVCLACSLSCHENHELIELYLKRNFCCDCGNPKFNSNPCQFTQSKNELNKENKYNQNYSGLYCICNRPYPDPESSVEDEMIQCIMCEDWLHSTHLDAVVPPSDQYSEMICKGCMDKNEFLHDYSGIAVKVENLIVDIVSLNNSIENGLSDDVKMSNQSIDQNMSTEDVDVKEKTECQKEIENTNNQTALKNGSETEKKINTEQPLNKQSSLDGSSRVKDDKNVCDDKMSEDSSIEISKPSTGLNNTLQESEKVAIDNVNTSPKVERTQDVTLATCSENDKDIKNEKDMDNNHCDKLEQTRISGSETSTNIISEEENKKDDAADPIKETNSTLEIAEKCEAEITKNDESENKNAGLESTDNNTKSMEISELFKSDSKNPDSQVNQEAGQEPGKANAFDEIITNDKKELTKENEEQKEIEDTKVDDSSKVHEKENGTADATLTNANENKRKLPMEDDKDFVVLKKSKVDDIHCIRPRGVVRCLRGATFWPSNFREKLCTCNECLTMYKDLSVLFLIDPEDTVSAYEKLGMDKAEGNPSTQYEKGLQALSSLDRVQQINALTEYNKMRDKLLDYLKSFKDRDETVKEEDIKAFFAGMKPKREPDGVYFFR